MNVDNETVKQEVKYSLWYWKLYYHLLLYLHFVLGIAGIVIGALIATGQTDAVFGIPSQALGVLSAVIVGIVSFMQPGRMASVFYDAYWRLRVATLHAEIHPADNKELIVALANGYRTVATIQPEALQKYESRNKTLDLGDLSDERKAILVEKLNELAAQEKAEKADMAN